MSIDLKKIQALKNDKIGYFRFKKLDSETYLITNDIGKYSHLSVAEFEKFIIGKELEKEKQTELISKKFIKDASYTEDMVRLFAKKNTFLSYGPQLHIVVTTLRCNHKCRYCHAAAAPEKAKNVDMTLETAKKVLDTIFYTSSQDVVIEFQGGESLLNWDVTKYFIEQAQVRALHLKKTLSLRLVSNLVLMNEERLSYLLDNNVQICTSLDGDEETHNFNRTYTKGNSFKEVVFWIKRINEEYEKRGFKQKVWAVLTPTRMTMSRYKEAIDTYVELGLDAIFLRPLNPYWFALAELKSLGYTSEEYVDFFIKSLEYILELNRKGVSIFEASSMLYLTKILTENDPNYMDERSPCGACIWQVAYNYDGKIYSCDEGRMMARMGINDFKMTDLKNTAGETYEAMIYSDTTKVMVQASTIDWLPWYNEDVYKPYIGVCPINTYKTRGNIYPNYAFDERRKINSAILDYLFMRLKEEENKKIFEKWLGLEYNPVVSQCEAF